MEDLLLEGKILVNLDKTYLKISSSLNHDERIELLNKNGIDFTLFKDNCFGAYDETLGYYHTYVLDPNKVNEGKHPLIEKLFKKLSNDNRFDFYFLIYYKYSSNVKSYNRSYSGSYDYGLPDRMMKKDLTELKKYFKNVKFEGRYSYEGGFDSDGYLWIVDFDTINVKSVENYLNEEIINRFEVNEFYQLQEDFIYNDYKAIRKGTIFKVKKLGSGWDNQRELEITSGFFKINKNALITEYKIDINSGSMIFSYDPYGREIPNVKKLNYPIPLDNSLIKFKKNKKRKGR